MKFDEDNDTYQLASGRSFYAFCGILGLTPYQGHEHELLYGSDGEVYVESLQAGGWDKADIEEVRAYMIALWQKWEPK